MKIAYLITAYGEYGHLRRLISALDDPGVRFFIHIDAKSPMPDGLAGMDNVTFIPRRKVWWGGWSHTEAIIDLMREAAAGDFGYCALISGADYPVRSKSALYRTLAGGGEFINATEGFRHGKTEKRIEYFHFDCFDRRTKNARWLFFRGLELSLRALCIRKRRYPFERIYTGTVWSVLTAGCVRHVLEYIDRNPRYVDFFRTALIPEEMFFQTIIGNSGYRDHIRGGVTYADWSGGGSGPALISPGHLSRFAPGERLDNGNEPFFARKFNDRSAEVVAAIDRMCTCTDNAPVRPAGCTDMKKNRGKICSFEKSPYICTRFGRKLRRFYRPGSEKFCGYKSLH